ncbi:hypothetical protein ASD00_17195 [Ensifer sp. Root31]|nr:hypothetical protein ASD00_17195 [Ensifer sp. Root31]
MWIAALQRTMSPIVNQWIDCAGRDIGIILKIPMGIKKRIGVAPFCGAVAKEVPPGIDPRLSYICVLGEIPVPVK